MYHGQSSTMHVLGFLLCALQVTTLKTDGEGFAPDVALTGRRSVRMLGFLLCAACASLNCRGRLAPVRWDGSRQTCGHSPAGPTCGTLCCRWRP